MSTKWTTSEMVQHLERQGIRVTPPAQRKTQSASYNEASDLQEEPGYQENPFDKSGTLSPKNWRALANPKVPWPHEQLPVEQALREMSSLLAYRILGDQAAAMGRSPEELYGLRPYDEV